VEWTGVESWALCGLRVLGYPLDLGAAIASWASWMDFGNR
jgi:hypothetical protein